MINFSKLWNKSGKQYQEYALNFPQYKQTNEKLVQIADIMPNQIVVDLACGTGLTTKEVLKNCPDVEKIYAIDFSEDMINVAKEFVQSKKVAFIVADAQDLDKFISEKVDVVICNSAFWQFQNQNQVLHAISNILKDNGKIIFNLNQQFFDFGKPEPNQKLLIDTIFSEMKKRGYKPSNKLKPKIGKEKIEELFSYAGYILEKTETLNIGPRKLDDFFNFFKIPATATFFENVSKENQEQILSSAYEKLKTQFTQIENNKWIYFVFKKIPSNND
ncbi:MAG: class I SAM-dependent methyltransferase [Candidatus Moraniibacteriota bacterium]|nr:MAG: class I SAM-dependent methyltransferase [Candidatus Moranbacteria bacterium]